MSRSKSRAKRSKTPVNPWRSLPRLATLFDAQTPQAFFKGSSIPDLEELTLTESQLLEQTAALLGVSLAQFARARPIVYPKREFLNSKHRSQAQDQTDNSLPRAGSGIAGVADARIQAAYDALLQANNPIPPCQARYQKPKPPSRPLSDGSKSITQSYSCKNQIPLQTN